MPKNVQLPSGEIVEFPDSMNDDAIGGVIKLQQMRQNVSPRTAPAAPNYQQQPEGFLQNLVAPIPQAAAGLYHSIADAPRTPEEQAIKGTNRTSGILANALGQVGLGGYRTLIAPSVDAYKRGDMIGAIPIAGPLAEQGAGRIAQALGGDVRGAIGGGLGDAIALGIGAKLPGALAEARIVAPEIAARNIAGKALMTPGGAYDSTVDALMREKGNVEKFAQDSGLRTDNPLRAAEATRRSADSLGDFYRNHLLAGAEDGEKIPVPRNFGVGAQDITKGRYATLSEIDARVKQLNDLTRPAENKSLELDTATGRAQKAALENEKNRLTEILDNSIADRLNLDPDAVKAVRQSMGARAQMADQLMRASNEASTATGRVRQGSGSSFSPSAKGAITSGIDRIAAAFTGGPEGKLISAFKKYYPQLDVPSSIGNPATLDELRGINLGQTLNALGRRARR